MIKTKKEVKMRKEKKALKTQYPVTILPESKKQFQNIMDRDRKTVWELFRDMVQAYEEKHNSAA